MARDLTGERFFALVGIEQFRARGSTGGIVWRFRCDCGNTVRVDASKVVMGVYRSCGCRTHLRTDAMREATGLQVAERLASAREHREAYEDTRPSDDSGRVRLYDEGSLYPLRGFFSSDD